MVVLPHAAFRAKRNRAVQKSGLIQPVFVEDNLAHCTKMTRLKTINIEGDLPTLDDARRLVIEEIKRAKREGVRVLKIIHGYGSSGKGGKLCIGLRKSFTLRKKEGVIKDFIAGEDFSIFNDATLDLLQTVPELRGDPDLNAMNEGVTFLWIK